jgi:internalin A
VTSLDFTHPKEGKFYQYYYCISDEIIKKFVNLQTLKFPFSRNPNDNRNITDEGVKYLTRLTTLELSNYRISDEGVQFLTNLTILDSYFSALSGNGIRYLTKLQVLGISNNKIIDDDVIVKLPNLHTLDISTCLNGKITASGLLNIKNLTALHLNGNYIISNIGLKSLTNLQTLYLDGNSIIHSGGITALTNLTTLSIIQNRKIHDYALQTLTKISTLILKTNHIISYRSVRYLTNLTYLDLTCDTIMACDEMIQDLVNLRSLNISSCSISNTALINLTNLTSLDISNPMIQLAMMTDMSLKHLTNLTYLNASDNENITEEVLMNLPNLKSINRIR